MSVRHCGNTSPKLTRGLTMSLLQEVLFHANQSEMKDLKESIGDLSRSVFDIKCEIVKEMESTYVNFSKMPSENQKLVHQLKVMCDEMGVLQERVDAMMKHELESSIGELNVLSSQLLEVGLQLTHVRRLNQLNEALLAAESAQESKEFPQAAKHVQNLQKLLVEIPSEDDCLDIYKCLRREKRLVLERLLYDLKEIWNAGLRWEEPEPDIDGLGLKDSAAVKRKKPHRACLHVDVRRLNELEGAFIALFALGHFDFNLSKFSANLMRLILLPLATQEGQVNILVTEGAGEVLLEVETHPDKPKPLYPVVLQNLRKVFSFMNQYLSLQVEGGEEIVTLVQRVGGVIGPQLCEALVTGCLANTVPAHGHDLKTFREAAAEAETFHHELKSVGFLSEESVSLLQYAANIDVLFANKICELHLQTAREIACKSLIDTMDVGESVPEKPLPSKKEEITGPEPCVKLSDNTFRFPKCVISKSAHELLQLLRQILSEASAGSDVSSGRLLLTARHVVELYSAISCTHHKKELSASPHVVALYHNNCMYLAHHLMTLGAEQRVHGCDITFLDQIQGLREQGASSLLKTMQIMKQQLIDTLRESGLSAIGEETSLPSTTQKAIRGFLLELQHLREVWGTVLPENNYCRAVGCLLNALVQEVVIRVVTLEDIPAHIANTLADLLTQVLETAPQVFPDSREVHRHVHHWHRLQALVKVLRASLSEIADYWADGAGPLAQAFTASELKQLIRALFQNNKRRAAILTLIK